MLRVHYEDVAAPACLKMRQLDDFAQPPQARRSQVQRQDACRVGMADGLCADLR